MYFLNLNLKFKLIINVKITKNILIYETLIEFLYLLVFFVIDTLPSS